LCKHEKSEFSLLTKHSWNGSTNEYVSENLTKYFEVKEFGCGDDNPY